MAYSKRVAVTTILGFIAGLVCYYGGVSAGIQYTSGMIFSTILNRTLIGFAIGISSLRMHYLMHGTLMGAIFTLPMAVYGDISGSITMLLFGIAYGFLIELIATKGLKIGMGR